MRLFLYEFITGGGTWEGAASTSTTQATASAGIFSRLPHAKFAEGKNVCDHALLAEGAAMVTGLAEDFLQIPGCEVHVLADSRLPDLWPRGCIQHSVTSSADEQTQFFRVAGRSDRTVVIAPESDQQLLRRVQWTQEAGGRLLSPGEDLVRLATSKHDTAEFLAAAGVPVPAGVRIKAADGLPTGFSYPAVLKPDDGAGSLDMCRVRHAADDAARAILERCDPARHFRLETYHPGQPASVTLLCGPRQRLALPPAAPHLADDGSFHSRGGRVPLQPPWAARAQRLAEQVASTLANPIGYIGIDLVLGADWSGTDDRVIEINPRLTTSYLGLRRLARGNLAAWLWAITHGERAELVFDDQPVDFQPTVPHPAPYHGKKEPA